MVISYLDGMIQIAVIFLSIVAGVVAISLFKASHKQEHLNPSRRALQLLFRSFEIFDDLLSSYASGDGKKNDVPAPVVGSQPPAETSRVFQNLRSFLDPTRKVVGIPVTALTIYFPLVG